ncbi:hypothetical protein KEM54_006411 [Ascosphaera aggregata]|nr:hypothetical protein KEM54_006411 [Ascosphaera aggregata]
MANQDLVEEDLFADLYDVDESAHQQPAASATTSAPPPAPAPAPAATATAAAATNSDTFISTSTSTSATATGDPVPSSLPPSNPSAATATSTLAEGQSNHLSFNFDNQEPTTSAYTGQQSSNENGYGATSSTTTSTMLSGMPQNGSAHQAINQQETSHISSVASSDQAQGTGIKEDGKMFIGGLNWETTDQSLKDYFSQFGEVQECTVMRDGATGRSRGFGFLTFKDPKTVNTVMVKEHYLDGKIIDPKRAIPRDEQERTSKIFVGGVSQDATEQDFKQFFMQFGRVVDATLMIDKDTGRPRGFGFVTFDSEVAVEATLAGPLEILGKPIEVKKAQPRNNLRDDDRGRRMNDRFREGERPATDMPQMQASQSAMAGMTPQMMAQYWQRMQQYFMMIQQQMAMAASQGQNMGMGMGMPGMNPMMQQQMQAQMGNMGQGMPPNMPQGGASAGAQPSSGPQGMQGMMTPSMNPAMMQSMPQNQSSAYNIPNNGMRSPVPGNIPFTGNNAPPGNNMNMNNFGNAKSGPGYNAQEQLAFEQQKYEQQQVRRATENRSAPAIQQGQQSSWEGMYDESAQSGATSQSRGTTVASNLSPRQQPATGKTPTPSAKGPSPVSQPVCTPPANAPTGPRNAGKPGANYRGGGRGGHRGFHPYSRS